MPGEYGMPGRQAAKLKVTDSIMLNKTHRLYLPESVAYRSRTRNQTLFLEMAANFLIKNWRVSDIDSSI
jgi:hypothetical protein